MGVTFLFQVDWLSGLWVIGIYLSFWSGGAFLTPLLKFWKPFWIQNKKLWGVTFLFEDDWLSGLGVWAEFLVNAYRVESRVVE